MYAYFIRKVFPFLLVWASFFLYSCASDESDGDYQPVDDYALYQPENFPRITYDLGNEPITRASFELGKKLFFDPILSRDGSISCDNCHIQQTAFADSPIHPVSIGIDSKLGNRNAPPLFNMAFKAEFFWDGGVTHLDFVPINAIESEVEMGDSLSNVIGKLNRHSDYPGLFKDAFGIEEITSAFMLKSLSHFTLLMISADSRYDQYIRKENKVFLSEDEISGMQLFQSKCAGCHSGALFTDQSFRNNGIGDNFPDEGRALITESPSDIGKFRVPTLRNIELTAPYMHNAAFTTLESVLDHYSTGVKVSSTLDPSLLENDIPGIPMTAGEKDQIILFLKTLTDRTFTSNPKFFNQR